MRGIKLAVIGAVGAALLLSACGGSDDSTSDATTTSKPATSSSTTKSASSSTTGGEVPDPCTLVPAAQLTADLGADVGTGTLQAPVPDQRKICRYTSGLILAVEVAENYDATVDGIRQNSGGATITEVPGVGKAAIWEELGNGLGQFVAQGDTYLVGVTVPSGGQAPGLTIAKEMLQAL